MTRKIAIIIERFDTTLGGAERSVGELADALATLGCVPHILAAKGQAESPNVHILCADQPGKRTALPVFAEALQKHISQNHYDVIHSALPFDFADVYQPRGGTYAEAALRNAASYGNVILATLKRTTAFLNLRRSALLRAERDLCRKQTCPEGDGPAIIAISQYVAEQFKRHYGVGDSRITVIPNGVEIKNVADKDAAGLRTQILSRLGVTKDANPVLFLFAANNFRLKGLGCLLKALSLLASKIIRDSPLLFPFLLVAGSDSRYPERFGRGDDKKVLYLGKVGDIGNLLAAADIAVLPTYYDPCSRFILEALAAGKPVITTKFNGAAELFTNNRHGRTLDCPDDINKLADALAWFTKTANIQKASQAIQQDNVRQRVSISRVADQLKVVYDAIIANRMRK